MDERRAARFDWWILILWVAASLLGRRALPLLPVRSPNPISLMSSMISFTPGELTFWRFVLFAIGLPLAVVGFHRLFRAVSPVASRLALVVGLLGFVALTIGLSLNIVEATAASAYLTDWTGTLGTGLAQRFRVLVLADDIVSGIAIWGLAAWMTTLSLLDRRAPHPILPAWFGWAGLAAGAVTAVGGTWGMIRLGSLRAVDGGDSLLLVHLWIGLMCSLLLERGSPAKGAA